MCIAMAHHKSLYRLVELIEVDDADIGANKTGKAGRRTPVIVTIDTTDEVKTGVVANEALDSLGKPHVIDFANRRLRPSTVTHSDAYTSLRGLVIHTTHIAKIAQLEEADGWWRGYTSLFRTSNIFCSGPTMALGIPIYRLTEDIDVFVKRPFESLILGGTDSQAPPATVCRECAHRSSWNISHVQTHVI